MRRSDILRLIKTFISSTRGIGRKYPSQSPSFYLKKHLGNKGFTSEQDFEDMYWIMMQESGGRVGVPGYVSWEEGGQTQRPYGLYQIVLPMNAGYYPRGAQSVGNPEEEIIGGVTYMMSRYGNPQNARRFWERNDSW